MKNEAVVKSEVIKSENAAAQQEAEIEIDPAEYEPQFEVMAMGVVADELPTTCVETFLKYIKDHH